MSNMDVWGSSDKESDKQNKKQRKTVEKLESKEWKPSRKRRRRSWDLSFLISPALMLLVLVPFILISTNVLLPMLSDLDFDELFEDSQVEVDGEWNVKVFVPDCVNGDLHLDIVVSGEYLSDNNLVKEDRNGVIVPVTSFEPWEEFVKDKTGSPIPDANACITLDQLE